MIIRTLQADQSTAKLWVEQPVGTGFSQGTPSATSERDVAAQFLGFFKNFLDTFELHNKKIFITGESYAGAYVPYIADAMLNTNDTKYYDVEATMIYDPYTSFFEVQEESKFASPWQAIMYGPCPETVVVLMIFVFLQFQLFHSLTSGLAFCLSTLLSTPISTSGPMLAVTPHTWKSI